MNKTIAIITMFIFLQPNTVFGQEVEPAVLHIQEAYSLLVQNWPVSGKEAFQRRITELNRKIAGSGWQPELQVSARASYQSDVTEVPFSAPGTETPVFS